MWLRLTRLFVAVLLLTLLWGLSLVRTAPNQVWIHPLNSHPGPVRILRFYASVGTLAPGEKAQLCYSVENAKAIRISPMLESAYPSLGRCIEIYPDHTTHYTLQAEGFDGTVAMRSITLPVQDFPGAPAPVQHRASLGLDEDPHLNTTTRNHSRISSINVFARLRMRKNCDRPCILG
jgi:hypothetical protein